MNGYDILWMIPVGLVALVGLYALVWVIGEARNGDPDALKMCLLFAGMALFFMFVFGVENGRIFN